MEAVIEYQGNTLRLGEFETDGFGYVRFTVRTRSYGFVGAANFVVREKRFRKFIRKMKSMNRLCRFETFLVDDDMGSYLSFLMDRLGHITIGGSLVYDDGTFNALSFEFHADQTVLKPFCAQLLQIKKEILS